jgi:uncharacterized protein YqeY
MDTLIQNEIKLAMKAKNTDRLRSLRSIKSQFDILKTSGKEVTEDVQSVTLQKMIKQRKDSADVYKSNQRIDLYDVEMQDISVIEEFLPKQLTNEEIEAEVDKIILEGNIASIRETGKIMGVFTKKFAGKVDNKIVLEIIKSKLS